MLCVEGGLGRPDSRREAFGQPSLGRPKGERCADYLIRSAVAHNLPHSSLKRENACQLDNDALCTSSFHCTALHYASYYNQHSPYTHTLTTYSTEAFDLHYHTDSAEQIVHGNYIEIAFSLHHGGRTLVAAASG